MAFAEGFPPRTPSGLKSIRFYATGTATANFNDNGNSYVFIDGAGANTFKPLPIVTGKDEKATTYIPGTGLVGAITSTANNGGGLIRCTDVAHGLSTGDWILVTDTSSATNLPNGAYQVTVITADTFDLVGSTWIAGPETANWTRSYPQGDAGTPRGTGETFESSAKALIWASRIRVLNDGTGDLEISFDGVNVHGKVLDGEQIEYARRHEAGICVRGSGGTPTYRIEAW